MIICYTVPAIWHVTYVVFIFYFELLFDLLKHLKISPFYPSVSKIRARSCMVPDILVTDRLMGGRRSDI